MSAVPGILINRERPLGSGFCGNDNCEHISHKNLRRAQLAVDNRGKKRYGAKKKERVKTK